MLNFQFTLNTHCGLYLALKVSLEKGGLFFVRVTLRYVPHIWRDRQDDTGIVLRLREAVESLSFTANPEGG